MAGRTLFPRTYLSRLILIALLLLTTLASLWLPQPRATAAAPGGVRLGIVADVGTRYGIYGSQQQPVNVLATSGTRWVKEEFRWDWVQPDRNSWTWAFMDEAVASEQARGMEILGLLDFTAGWAVGEGRPVSPTPPPLDLWCTYVAQVVGRYHDRVHAWEVWNEPNMPHFWAGTPQQYATLLAATYDTIKAIDRSAIVVGPSISGVDEGWLDAVSWDKFDVLGVHMYVPPAFLNDEGYSYYNQGLPNLKRIVDRHGGKPIWITEFGYSSGGGPMPWYVGDEGLQARYLVQHVAETLAFQGLSIERVMPYVFNNHEGFELVRDWQNPKPAFRAYSTAIARLDGASGRGQFSAGPGVMAFRFARGDRQIDVLWAPHGGTATIPSGSDGEVTDLYGTTRSIPRSGAELRLAVGPDPIYLVHAAASGGGGGLQGPDQYFAETGKTTRGAFLSYWKTKGGLPAFGYPISDELWETLEDGNVYLVQYFERARFEYHPENPAPYNVLLGQFGRRLHPLYPAVPDCGCGRYFPQTGHNVAGNFLTYWERNGGLAQFGYPLTDQVTETLEDGKTYTVQWFERARLEYHPENPAPYDILLGQFGRAIYEQNQR